ncbi:hypothetical protein GUJ93_ZPchr0004g40261 [Zizania palustris]|uniref:Protein kinase domain-containing protein n=1 Tax=Zizania palustris TaxID=103762 RepID=A0A8J5V9W2_ZIZPA|nr:hypothetical protein GUJ93_ZPchr0004g40261 [Zizania palustris]
MSIHFLDRSIFYLSQEIYRNCGLSKKLWIGFWRDTHESRIEKLSARPNRKRKARSDTYDPKLLHERTHSRRCVHAIMHATSKNSIGDRQEIDMRCRRASMSATAAAAAVRQLLGRMALALGLALLTAMPHGPLSGGLALLPLTPLARMNLTCNWIPSPLGLRGRSLPGFEVTCGPNKEAMLPIGGRSYRIDGVSTAEGTVTISAAPIYQVCYDRSGRPNRTTGAGRPMNLKGTPFFFSMRNKLVATGCNYRFLVNFSSSSGGKGPVVPIMSCGTWCYGSSDVIINGSCVGTACCNVNMPMDGGQEFTYKIENDTKPSANVTGVEAGACSAVFFLDQSEKVFTNGGDRARMPLKDALVPVGERKMVLDWAIGNVTCKQAQSNSFAPQYMCNNVSSCTDAPSGTGYLCRCNGGYSGNPYATDGCLDINECRDGSHNCTFPRLCQNTPGSYNCSCPENMFGDGYTTGTGCNESPVPSGSPTKNQTQGLNVCTDPEKNPCIHQKYCRNEEGVTLCDCPEGMNGDGRKKGSGCKKHIPLDIVLGVGLAVMVTLATTLMCYYWTIKKRNVAKERAELFRKNGGLLLQQRFSVITSQCEDSSAKIFSAEELKNATDNYSESRILGRGGNGMVYKGILPSKTVVAIKKSILFDESQVEQFVNEITILSQVDHPNVVKLMGCCLETKVPLLVYEFIPNGTLFEHIHSRRSFTWEDCLRMAEETAQALAYLHSTSSTPIIHRDIKSSNILLDENFVAKISDFGASRSVPFDHTHITTLIQGTIGYLDPEYFRTSQLTEKSDVYSFGVVLAELLTRKKPICVGMPEESCNLAMYIVILLNEGRLLQEIEPHILAEAGEEQLYSVAHLSVRCLNLKGEERPVMKEVASILHGLRESFAREQTIRTKDEPMQKTNGQESVHREARPIPSLQSSEESFQYSRQSEMLASSQMAR